MRVVAFMQEMYAWLEIIFCADGYRSRFCEGLELNSTSQTGFFCYTEFIGSNKKPTKLTSGELFGLVVINA